jgi:hypothetical protein
MHGRSLEVCPDLAGIVSGLRRGARIARNLFLLTRNLLLACEAREGRVLSDG